MAIGVQLYVPVSPIEIAMLAVAVTLLWRSGRWFGPVAGLQVALLAVLGVALTGSVVFALALAATMWAASRVRGSANSPTTAADFGRECVLILAGLLAYEIARMLTESDFSRAKENALHVVEAERTAGLYVEATAQDWLTGWRWLATGLTWIYSYSFLTLVACTLLWLFLLDRANYRLLRNALGLSSAVAIATITAFPVAPPRLVAELGIADTAVVLGGAHHFANDYAAVPSLHVGWLALAGFVIGRSSGSRWVAVGAYVPSTIMLVVVVATGNHYLVDGLAGVLIAVGSGIVLNQLDHRRSALRFLRGIPHSAERLLDSNRARFSAVALAGLLTFLAVGDVVSPGFTAFWGYLLFQMVVTLVLLLAGQAVFRSQGGLTWQTHLLAVACGYADVLGTAGDLYANIDEYDKFTHFMGVAAITSAAFDCLAGLQRRRSAPHPSNRVVWVAVAVGMAAGIGWEVYEWLGDAVFHTKRVQSHFDTANDLVFDFLGAAAAGFALRRWERAKLNGVPATLLPDPRRG